MSWQCVACLQSNPPGTKFCGHCGARAAEDAAQSVVQTIADLTAAPSGSAAGGGERAEQRRLITIVFADISGFTPLADRLDPEEVAAAVDPILARMAAIIERYDGHLHQYAGDAIIAYFGAPVAHEDDAVRALLAARDMHAEVAEVVATLPPEVSHVRLHIGVNTGHVVTGFRGDGVRLDYYALGDAVNTAQRLEAACPVGEVYVGDLTRRLAEPALTFESVGELVMKGKPQPVVAWRLVREAEASATAPEAMVGRAAELDVVNAALSAAGNGEPVVLGIVGEPGVGKTRLLVEARERALAAGMRWLDTRCLSYGTVLAYRPYLELLRRMAGARVGDHPEQVQAQLAAVAAELGLDDVLPYLKHVAGVPGDDIPDAIRHNAQALRTRVQDALVEAVLALTARGPVVLAIEDMHWMDSASVDVTALLLARAAQRPLCLAGTARPEGRAHFDRFADAVRAERIELSGLDPAAAHRMAESIAGAPIDPAAMSELLARTGGNALFVQEVVRSLLDAGAIRPGPTGMVVDLGGDVGDVPSTIESVLAARIDLLPLDATDVLGVASVVGREVRLPLLRGLVPLDEAALDAVLDVLVSRQFLDRVVEGGEERVVFHHALVADVAYGRLLRRRRRELHRRLLEVALRLYGDGDDAIDLLARNAYLGDMGTAALPYLVRAAERAAALFANAQAMTFLQQAIEIVEGADASSGQLSQLLMQLGRLQDRTGPFEDAVESFRRAYHLDGEPDAAIAEARTLNKLDRAPESLAVLDEVKRKHPELSTEQHAQIALERARALSFGGHTRMAVQVLSTQLAGLAAQGAAGTTSEAEMRVFRARLLCQVDAIDEALSDAAAAARQLESAGDLPRLSTALRVLGGVLTESGRAEEGIATLERALDVARQVGHAEEIAACSINLGYGLWGLGRRDEALEYDQQAIAACESMGLKAGVANAKVNLCDKLIDLERWDEARDVGQQALEIAGEAGHQVWYAGALADLAIIAMAQHDYPAAADHAERAQEVLIRVGNTELVDRMRTIAEQARESLRR
jgi:class 3 adenylate cyclase/tetratricopeptide (TPR) repeat protein